MLKEQIKQALKKDYKPFLDQKEEECKQAPEEEEEGELQECGGDELEEMVGQAAQEQEEDKEKSDKESKGSEEEKIRYKEVAPDCYGTNRDMREFLIFIVARCK